MSEKVTRIGRRRNPGVKEVSKEEEILYFEEDDRLVIWKHTVTEQRRPDASWPRVTIRIVLVLASLPLMYMGGNALRDGVSAADLAQLLTGIGLLVYGAVGSKKKH